jgi:hypothetical protein
MIIRNSIIALSAISLAAGTATAKQPNAVLQAIDDALPGTLINDPTVVDWVVYGNSKKPKQVAAPETPGQYAMQLKVVKKGAQKYDMGVNVPIRTGIESGNMITVAFWARAVKADTADGNGIVGVRINENKEPYGGFGDRDVKIGSEWKLYEAKMRSTMTLAAGQAVAGFQLAGAKQTIEIGQVYVLDMGAS